MKELLFRAWDKYKKIWISKEFSILGKVTVFNLFDQYNYEDYDDIEITQYIGLKDKNGKKIFEGDLWYHDQLHGIRYYDGSFNICVKDIISFVDVAKANQEYFDDKEIIGNIYENPEYIGGDK